MIKEMIIGEDVKQVLAGTAFLSLVTIGLDGNPHPIVAGKGEVVGDTVIFGIYKMEQTQKNLSVNNHAWVVGATMIDGKPKGYRLTGTAEANGKQLVFSATKTEVLI
ncbi:MAG: pyridoxamine 5'-phosphate oxidase family protein [Termitinemataceae bacterium]|nr:MAG: pyridoxamine 5'-phosphate oxidase family protein [Termitinemataceae bacterium]